jgi:hypothetical protein
MKSSFEKDLICPKTLNVAFSAKVQTTSASWCMRVVWPDSSLVFRTRRPVEVKGTIDGQPFEDRFWPVGDGAPELHVLRYICQALKKKEGDTVNIFLEERV